MANPLEKLLAPLSENERQFEKNWPGKAGLSMEDVARRLDKYGGKGKMRIPHRQGMDAQEWRRTIIETAREAQHHIVREKVRRSRQMGPPARRVEEGEIVEGPQENPPIPWGGRTQAREHPDASSDRHSQQQVAVERAGVLSGGSRRRAHPPDRSHSNESMVELQSASDAEMASMSDVATGDAHEPVDLTATTDEEGGVAPSPHYRQGEDDFPDETDANNKFAMSLGFKNQKAWSQAWAAQFGETNTEEMHRMIRGGIVNRDNRKDRGDDMMARTYGYKNYKDMFKSVPHFRPDLTGVQWNTHIAQMRKHFQTELENKSRKGFLGGWTISEAARAMGAKGHKHFLTTARADKVLHDWGKKHQQLRKHFKETSNMPNLDVVAQVFGFQNWEGMRHRFEMTGKDPSRELKKLGEKYKVKQDAPTSTPDERTLKAHPSLHKVFGHPSARGPSPEVVGATPFQFHTVSAVVQSEHANRPAASSADPNAIQAALAANGQPTQHGRQPVVTPIRVSGPGPRRNPARAARSGTLSYEAPRTPTEMMHLGDPRRQQKTPTKQAVQKKIREETAKINHMDTPQLKAFMTKLGIDIDSDDDVDELRYNAIQGMAVAVRRAAGVPAAQAMTQPIAQPFQPRGMPTRGARGARSVRTTGAGKKRRRRDISPFNDATRKQRHAPRRRPASPRFGDDDEKMQIIQDPPTPGEIKPKAQRRLAEALGRAPRRILSAPSRVARGRRDLHARLKYGREGVVRTVQRNIVSPFRMNYKARGGHGWTPTPRLSVNQIDAGRFLLRARRGVTKGVRHQVMHLLNRVRGKLKINGRIHSKLQAREVIIDLLAQNTTVDVEIHV